MVAAVVLLVVGVIAFLLTHGGDEDTTPPDEPGRAVDSAADQHVRAGDLRPRRPRRDGDRRRGQCSVDPDDTAFQWLRCKGAPSSAPRSPARPPTIDVTGDDVDHSLRVEVTATAGDDEVTVRSAPTPVVPAWPSSPPLRSAGPPRSARPLLPPPASGRGPRPCSPCSGSSATGITACSRSRAPRPRPTWCTGDVAGAVRAEVRPAWQARRRLPTPRPPAPSRLGTCQCRPLWARPSGADSRLASAGLNRSPRSSTRRTRRRATASSPARTPARDTSSPLGPRSATGCRGRPS